MARGLTRDQIGVTEEMILTYGERIWELSSNIQIRRGDPVRELDWEQIEAQRHGRGMADIEIAEEIGLTREQVLYIRLVLERRRFRRENYHRLYELGGGRRFRSERFVPYENRFGFRAEAIELRKALEFDPRTAGSYLRLGYWNADTVATWLDRWAKERPDHPAVVFEGKTSSYGQVRDQALRLANALVALGLRRGDVIAVQLGNVPEFLQTYFATCMMGGVVCALPPSLSDQDLETALQRTNARAVICHEAGPAYDAPTTMLNLGLKLRPLEHVIVVSANPPEGTNSFAGLAANASATAIEMPPVASDPAVIFLSDGGAEPPKMVLHNYHTMLSNSRIVAPIYSLGPDDGVLSIVPLSEGIGLAAVNLALHAGAAVHLVAEDVPEAWTTAIETAQPTVLFVPSSRLEAHWAAGGFGGADLASIRKAAFVGGSVSEQILRDFDAAMANGTVARMWGAAECLMVLHTSFDAPEDARFQSLGTPTGSFAVRMVSPSGDPVPPGTAGEMQVRGCSLFAGYVGDRDASRNAFSPDGWFRAGDSATTDEDGNVRISGREESPADTPRPMPASNATGS